MVVLHYTAMPSSAAALSRLCDPAHEVSAHYLIDAAGRIYALVPEERRAWHAGAGSWGGVTDVNSRSIGVELANPGDCPFPAAQMDALESLLGGVMRRWAIAPGRVIGHSDMAPRRKSDPGPRFDWRRLALGGFSVWPEPAARDAGSAEPDPAAFAAAAERFGYGACGEEALLRAFRLRFRPGAGGPLAPADMVAMAQLAALYPVDPGAAEA